MTHRERPAESHTGGERGELFYVIIALKIIILTSIASYYFPIGS